MVDGVKGGGYKRTSEGLGEAKSGDISSVCRLPTGWCILNITGSCNIKIVITYEILSKL